LAPSQRFGAQFRECEAFDTGRWLRVNAGAARRGSKSSNPAFHPKTLAHSQRRGALPLS
jgi:hypothetical protein